MPKRQPADEVLPEPLPTQDDLAEVLSDYLKNWSWRQLEEATGLSHRTLRKILEPEENDYWYESARKFWEFHCRQWAEAET